MDSLFHSNWSLIFVLAKDLCYNGLAYYGLSNITDYYCDRSSANVLV